MRHPESRHRTGGYRIGHQGVLPDEGRDQPADDHQRLRLPQRYGGRLPQRYRRHQFRDCQQRHDPGQRSGGHHRRRWQDHRPHGGRAGGISPAPDRRKNRRLRLLQAGRRGDLRRRADHHLRYRPGVHQRHRVARCGWQPGRPYGRGVLPQGHEQRRHHHPEESLRGHLHGQAVYLRRPGDPDAGAGLQARRRWRSLGDPEDRHLGERRS